MNLFAPLTSIESSSRISFLLKTFRLNRRRRRRRRRRRMATEVGN